MPREAFGTDTTGKDGYQVDLFRPEDAPGVVALLRAVYGESYPLRAAYSPEQRVEEHRQGRQHAVVARLPDGSLAGHMALFRTSSPWTGLWEFGQGMIHPDWRHSFILFHLFSYFLEMLPRLDVDVLYGEAVCSHTKIQQLCMALGHQATGLALDLMPGDGSGRVACLLVFKVFRDRWHRLYPPAPYRQLLGEVIAKSGLNRELVNEEAAPLADAPTRLQSELFSSAGVLRLTLLNPGADLAACLARAEAKAAGQHCALMQAFLNLGDPSCPAAAAVFREAGFFFGGLLPRWFDSDGLMLQKPIGTTTSANIALHSEHAKALLTTIRREQQGRDSLACPGTGPRHGA